MSYNGIGLQSARGSATSGHVQRNLASLEGANTGHYKKRQHEQDVLRRKEERAQKESNRRKARKILDEHESKRLIEIKCMELRVELEDNEEEEEIIEKKVRELRQKLREEGKPKGAEKPNESEKKESKENIEVKRSTETNETDCKKFDSSTPGNESDEK